MSNRVTIPTVFHQFAAYHAKPENGAWGSLHVVLEDGNVENHSVEFCAKWARERGDIAGERLAGILLRMTRTQRGKLANLVSSFERGHFKPNWLEPIATAVSQS